MAEDTRTNEQIIAQTVGRLLLSLQSVTEVGSAVAAALAAAGRLVTPPLGYVVLAKRPDRNHPDTFTYDAAGSIWPDLDPVENHQVYCELSAEAKCRTDVEYIIGAISEVAS